MNRPIILISDTDTQVVRITAPKGVSVLEVMVDTESADFYPEVEPADQWQLVGSKWSIVTPQGSTDLTFRVLFRGKQYVYRTKLGE